MGATSAGSIQMELEIKSDLDDDIKDEASKLADRIRKQVDSMSGDMFKNLRQSLVASLDKMTESVKSCLDKTKSEMQAFVEQMAGIVKQISDIQMPYRQAQSDTEPSTTASQGSSVRGPPGVSIRKPKIVLDAQFDTEMFHQKYAELENMMDMYDNQILAKQAQRKTLLESYKPNMSVDASNALDKQVMALDIQIAKLQDAASRTNITLSGMDRQMSSTGASSSQVRQIISELVGTIGGLKGKVASATLKGLSGGFRIIASGAKLAGNAIMQFTKRLSTTVIQKFNNALRAGGRLAVSFTTRLMGLGSAGKKASSGLGHAHMGIGQLIKSFTIFSLIFPLVSRGIMALAQNMGATLMTNAAFANSLNQIRSNLATAFTPIFQAIMPALNALMSALATVTGYIAAFISAIFGKSMSTTKQATSGIYAAKDAMGAYGASADKAAKATEKARRTLMGFDEINKLDELDNSSGAGGGGGGGSDMPVYTPTDVDDGPINKWVKKLKDLWAKGDYAGIGKVIGEQVNKAVLSFTNWISWDNIGASITDFCNGFTELFNSLIATINWENVGRMFGTGINTIVNTIYLLLTGVDWDKIGAAFANGINGLAYSVDWAKLGNTIGAYFQARINALYGFVTTVDWPAIGRALATGVMSTVNSINWGKLGDSLSKGIRGLAASIKSFIANIDWAQLGRDVWIFLSSIDWSGIISDLAYIIGQSIAGIGQLLWGFIEDAVNSIVKYWSDIFKETGGNIIQGLLLGIVKAIAGIGNWLKKNLVDPFINGFKSLFGIHSPSKVMANMGGFLIDGLLNGIKAGVKALVGLIPGIFGGLVKAIGGVWDSIKKGASKAWDKITSGIGETWKDLKRNTGKFFGDIGKKISDTWDGIKTGAGEAWNDITSGLSDSWENLKSGAGDFFGDIGNKIDEVWNGTSKKSKSAWSGINSTVYQSMNSIRDTISVNSSEGAKQIEQNFNTARDKLTRANNTMNSNTQSVWGSMTTTIFDKCASVKNGVTRTFKDTKSSVDTSSSGIKSSFTGKLTEAVNWVANTMDGKMNTNAKNMMNKFKSGAGSVDVKSAVTTSVGKATSWLSGLKNSSYTWGDHMISNFASGIKYNMYKVVDQVSTAAKKVASWLHFTRPDVGPLREYEQWMPHMMDGLSKTLAASTPKFIGQVKGLSQSMSGAMQAALQEPTIAFAGEKTLNVQHEWKEERQSDEISLKDVVEEIKSLKQKFDEVKQAVENKDTDVYMDGEKVTKKVVENVNKDTRKNGKCPIDT